jgi:hypothetical protein
MTLWTNLFEEVTFIFNSANYWGGYVNEKTIERQKSGENGIFRVFLFYSTRQMFVEESR